MGGKPDYRSNDIWAVAFCLAYGIELVHVEVQADGRVAWILNNIDDKAWQTSMDFRTGGERALVDAQRFRSAYRYASKQAAIARTGASDEYPRTR